MGAGSGEVGAEAAAVSPPRRKPLSRLANHSHAGGIRKAGRATGTTGTGLGERPGVVVEWGGMAPMLACAEGVGRVGAPSP